MAYPSGVGLGSMAAARMPSAPQGGGLMSLQPPMSGPNSAPPDDKPIGEVAHDNLDEVEGASKLIGQFENEIQLSDDARRDKEWAWCKIEKYLRGKDVNEPREGYEESTFFYRRLPRIVQIGRAKLYKQVCPLQGRPWEIKPSPRRRTQMDPKEEERRVSRLREEFEDIHEAMELENCMDEMCTQLSSLGSSVVIGPTQLRQPALRWNDGDEEIDKEDVRKPMWEFIDPKRVYPDPNTRFQQGLEYVHVHHVMSAHQIRSLQDDPTFINSELADLIIDMPDGNWAGNLRRWEIFPFPTNISNAMLNRYIVWRRIGVLNCQAMEDLGEDIQSHIKELEITNDEGVVIGHRDFKGLDKAQKNALIDGIWEIWWCGNHILKVSKRKFQPKRMYVHFIPFRVDPGSIFGVGAGESGLEVCEMLINICRSIDDALADTSGFQAMIDAGAIENKDLTIRGRKTWLWRDKGVGKKIGATGKPIELFTVPSNLDKLLECAKYFESLIPVVTGFTENADGKALGSGVRTDDMLERIWESLEEFIKDVVGNVDRYWWKPHLRDCYHWIKTYYDNKDEFMVEADLQVQGVKGALRREIVGRKAKELFKELHQYGLPKWMDEVEFLKAISEGMGLDQELAVKTVDQYVEAMKLELQQKILNDAPANAQKDKERAHASALDTMAEIFKAGMTQGKDGLPPPIVIPAAEQMFKLTGKMDEKTIAAFAVWSTMLSQQYLAAASATAEQAKVLSSPVPIDGPNELTPAAKQAQQQAQQPPQGVPQPQPAQPPQGMQS